MMIKPSIDQLTHGGQINRYELVIATSKVARAITDEYCEQREHAEAMVHDQKDKTIASFIRANIRDKKAVENAVQALAAGEYEVVVPASVEANEDEEEAMAKEAATEESAE